MRRRWIARLGIARLGVTQKLWLSTVALVLAVLLPVGFAVDRAVTAFYHQQNAADLLLLGQRFAEFYARAPAPGASEAVRALAQITATPLLVLDRQGITVAGSSELTSEIGNRPQNPRILSALGGEETVFLASDDTLPGSLLVTAVPIRQGGEITGAVVLFRPADPVQRAVARIRLMLALAAVGLLLLLAAFGWLMSRRLVRPLLAMKSAADQMARGDFAARVEAGGEDELGRLAAAINGLASRLHQLETGRRSFFANISHELRTPLSYLRGYADALAEGLASSPEEVKEYGRILADESRRLGRLVDDLFVLAQAEEGRLSLRLTDINMGEAVGKVQERLRPVADEKGIEVAAAVDQGLRAIADPDRLEQILLNLLDNAIRHTPAGGKVRVSAARANPATVVVLVDDSGPGLEGDPSHVWERFYRGDRSRNRDLGGAGLGLAIVQSLVEAHGGQVWAEAHGPLGGARFGFTLEAASHLDQTG